MARPRDSIFGYAFSITLRWSVAAEIGVWKGDFAQAILANFSTITKYYMIDPWAHLPDWNKPFNANDQTFEEAYAEALRKTDFAASRRIVLRGRTSAVIGEIPDQSLDFAYIDGDRTLRGITLDQSRKLMPPSNSLGLRRR